MNIQYIGVEGIMKVELTINKSKELPRGAIFAGGLKTVAATVV